jgi:hypothetical protein
MAFLFERKNTYGFFGNDLTLKDQFLEEGGVCGLSHLPD